MRRLSFACVLACVSLVAGAQPTPGWTVQLLSTARQQNVEHLYTSQPGEWILLTVTLTPPAGNGTAPLPQLKLTATPETSYSLQYLTCHEQGKDSEFRSVPTMDIESQMRIEDMNNQAIRDLKLPNAQRPAPKPRFSWYGMMQATGKGFASSYACLDTNRKKDKPLVLLMDAEGKNGTIVLQLPRAEAINLTLAFRVPAEAKGLQMHLGDVAPVAVPDAAPGQP
jgi:hypothetical protein